MIKTLKIKITTNDFQHRALLSTMGMFNQICNEISEIAFWNKEYRPFHLHKIVYYDFKNKYTDYSSQLIIRAINCVSLSYKMKGEKRNNPTRFKKTSAVVYDVRILSFDEETISIWTVEGRLKNIPIVIHNKELFKYRKGQTDLKYENGNWFLLCCVEIPDEEKIQPKGCIGVDLGVKNIAVSSDKDIYSGEKTENKRKQYSEHRRRLQKRGTRSAKRRIKTIGRKESRFRKDVNHQISKKLVEKAKGTNCALVLEELKGINNRVTVRKSQRNERMSWSFYQLRSFIEYKAKEAGVQVLLVPAPYTSQTCSECGHCEKKNRKNQSTFICLSCGFATSADYNASVNIKTLGEQSISLLLGTFSASKQAHAL
jgi:IS605 OrfB family transposase